MNIKEMNKNYPIVGQRVKAVSGKSVTQYTVMQTSDDGSKLWVKPLDGNALVVFERHSSGSYRSFLEVLHVES